MILKPLSPPHTPAEQYGRLVSVSLHTPDLTVRDFLRHAKGKRERFYWRDGRDPITFAAVGIAAELTAWGENRYELIERKLNLYLPTRLLPRPTSRWLDPACLVDSPSATILYQTIHGLPFTPPTLYCPIISYWLMGQMFGSPSMCIYHLSTATWSSWPMWFPPCVKRYSQNMICCVTLP